MTYETIIGIECHVQLKTKTKLFCACDNDAREAEPNTKICPVCMGMPGSLPVLNEQAVKLALKLAIALNGKVPHQTKFDRKNYFYPDLPSGYQITQFDQPIIGEGCVEFPLDGETVRIGITRAHMEADAGKLVHPDSADYSLVDLNRSGTPLIEIVSEPDMRTAAQAKAYAQELYNLVRYADVGHANLYYGNMRFDVNVSLRPVGQKEFGTRTETKNLNSFRAVEKAVEYEIMRQTEVLDRGDKIVQETRGWNDAKGQTYSQRSKEEAHDYRYFPEPDLPPVVITAAMKEEAAESMSPLPNQLRAEMTTVGLAAQEIEVLVQNLTLSQLFQESMAAGGKDHAKRIANWLVGEVQRTISDADFDQATLVLKIESLIGLSRLVADGKLSATAAKQVLGELISKDQDPAQVAERLNLIQVSDTGAIEKIVEEVIADNPKAVEDYKAGKQQALGALVGQIMKASNGQANPQLANELLLKKLSE
ncbi:MAG TPA: Asp-tRNA(Asn)/Glu-tRNA(Gln) amidotransferase subunit GatB [Candidatus Nanoarchaeia archaeon]|nr:Asp-tRNA(Asn)/Glu-tRNA(Gln) amidotransferase subunit GatB [Candidatus Nanoarchaeia archaeon]